jgi:aromatic-L-amino-acid decarboxylase
MPAIEPGWLRPLFPAAPPEAPEPIETILADYQRLIEPNITHWQHPRFLAYFSSAASGPGIIGEMLTAVLNSNVMLWRTSPAGPSSSRSWSTGSARPSGCRPLSTAC